MAQTADSGHDDLTRLHPNYQLMKHVAGVLMLVPLGIAAVAGQVFMEIPYAALVGALIALFVWLAVYLPIRAYKTRGFDMATDRLRVVRGVLLHSDTIVPFSRVQHLDVEQGPLERAFGLASLTLHTAGSYNSSVILEGLAHDDAVRMREAIRTHLKREFG